ncbi:MAG: hypothetical protein EP323_08635 [Gammaproteobacteria bacterium]|nr:MAG: hypothetical protein EP323_08635 [Gammaproteobacteria bacterium]
MNPKNIAIIGAGLAGATLANRLIQAGWQVTLYEKSRGTGGRLASCRLSNTPTNLGAPWFESRSQAFHDWLLKQPDIHKLFLQPHDFNGTALEPLSVFSAKPYQSGMTRRLTDGAVLHTGMRISAIHSTKNGVTLEDANGRKIASHDAVVVTVPAMQALPLLSPVDHFVQLASSVSSAPTWVTVVGLEQSSGASSGYLRGQHPVLSRAICTQRGPHPATRPFWEIWQLEANIPWSMTHEDSPSHEVAVKLLESFSGITRQTLNITGLRTHRWLYARHESPLTEDYLWSHEQHIGACGDWFRHSDCEGAWLSANAMADQLLLENT